MRDTVLGIRIRQHRLEVLGVGIGYLVAGLPGVWGALIALQIASAIWYALPGSVLEKHRGMAS